MEFLNSDFWFYTLSAIPQTLGAIIALTATFVVFRLAKLNDSIDSHIYHLKIILRAVKGKIPIDDNPQNFLNLLFGEKAFFDSELDWARGKKAELVEAYRTIIHDKSSVVYDDELKYWFNYQIAEDFKRKFDERKNIISYLYQTLYFIVPTIILSLLFLPLFESLSYPWPTFIISILVGLSGGGIVATAISILRIVNPQLLRNAKFVGEEKPSQ